MKTAAMQQDARSKKEVKLRRQINDYKHMGIDVQFLVDKMNQEKDEVEKMQRLQNKSYNSSRAESAKEQTRRSDTGYNLESAHDSKRETNALSTIKKSEKLLNNFPVFKEIRDTDRDLVAQGHVQTEFYRSVDNLFQLPEGPKCSNTTLYVDKMQMPKLKSKIK